MSTNLRSSARSRGGSRRVALVFALIATAAQIAVACDPTASADVPEPTAVTAGSEPVVGAADAGGLVTETVGADGAAIDFRRLEESLPAAADDIVPALGAAEADALNDLLVGAGITDVLPGAADALATVEVDIDLGGAESPQSSDVTAGTEPPTGAGKVTQTGPTDSLPPTDSPPPAGSAPPAGGSLSLKGGAAGVLLLGTSIAGVIHDTIGGRDVHLYEMFDSGPVTDRTPPVQVRHVDGTTELRVVQRVSESVDGGVMTVDMDIFGTMDTCPSADGSVAGHLSTDVRITVVSGLAEASGRYTMELDVTADVDDAARLAGFVIDVTGSASDTTRTSPDAGAQVEGWFIEGGSRSTFTGHPARDFALVGVDGGTITRHSVDVDYDMAVAFIDKQATLAMLAVSGIMVEAEHYWRAGSCVDVQLVPAGDPTAVAPGAELAISVEATSAIDGQPIDAPAVGVATATGGSVSPSQTPQPLPASVVYVVPADGSKGEVHAEVTSRRGIGTGSLVITAERSLVVDGPLDVFHAKGTKCGGRRGTWELALTAEFGGFPFTGVLTIDLTSNRTGTYTLVGSTTGGGVTIDQHGSGTVEAEPWPGGVELHLTGTAWTGGPTQTRSVDAVYGPGGGC